MCRPRGRRPWGARADHHGHRPHTARWWLATRWRLYDDTLPPQRRASPEGRAARRRRARLGLVLGLLVGLASSSWQGLGSPPLVVGRPAPGLTGTPPGWRGAAVPRRNIAPGSHGSAWPGTAGGRGDKPEGREARRWPGRRRHGADVYGRSPQAVDDRGSQGEVLVVDDRGRDEHAKRTTQRRRFFSPSVGGFYRDQSGPGRHGVLKRRRRRTASDSTTRTAAAVS